MNDNKESLKLGVFWSKKLNLINCCQLILFDQRFFAKTSFCNHFVIKHQFK